MNEQLTFPLKGYLLLTPDSELGYRGVDREHFYPALLDEEIDWSGPVVKGEMHIYSFYRTGWRRDAYRLYEENLVPGTDDDVLYLLSNVEVAREIRDFILPHVGPYEIVGCQIWGPGMVPTELQVHETDFLGYDVAYLGGDFYSAIFNGISGDPNSELATEYKMFLTEFGLFQSVEPIPGYIRRFKQIVRSEANSEFGIYQLSSEY